MGRSLSPLLRQEQANLDKDADSRRFAMKVLKSYAKDLDSKALPHFLAEVFGTNGPGSATGECTISLYEILARVYGRNIVPLIDNIMSTIMRTLSSSGGSFPLHQACSKVVPAIARYGIDPSTLDEEKTRIICSLCKPLSDALMGSQESAASGAALCLEALVESGNWRYASDEMVNEVCLKVAGALEEKVTQTNAHMGLVMALAKHNGLIAEAYARSLVRSGLQIFAAGVADSNSQKRLTSIQMINFLMKCVDPRSISSELLRIIDVMDKCQADDQVPYVRGAAFEALQTAKALTAQKGSKHEIGSSPVLNSSFDRRDGKSSWPARDIGGATGNHTPEFCSPESQTVDSCISYDYSTQVLIGQPSCNFERRRRTNRRLWNNKGIGVDISLKDGFFLRACSSCNDTVIDCEQMSDGHHSEANKEHSEVSSGIARASSTDLVARDTKSSPQRTRPQLAIDDIKIYTTPRKLIRSLKNSSDPSSGHLDKQSTGIFPSLYLHRLEMDPTASPNCGSQSQNLNSRPEGRRNFENSGMLEKKNKVEDSELVQDAAESVSSAGEVPENSIGEIHRTNIEYRNRVAVKSKKRFMDGKATLRLLWALSLIIFATILSSMRIDSDEFVFDVIPT